MDEMKIARNQFTFYRSFYTAAQQLPRTKRLTFYETMIAYALDETEPASTDTLILALFTVVKPTLDAARRKAGICAKGGKASAGVKKHRRTQPADDDDMNTERSFSVRDDNTECSFSVRDDNTECSFSVAGSNSKSKNKKEKEKENKNYIEDEIENENKTENETEADDETEPEMETQTEGKRPRGERWTPLKEGEFAPCAAGWNDLYQSAYGKYGHVMLKSGEYSRLAISLGHNEAQNCISFTDWQAEQGMFDILTDWPEEVRRCSVEGRYKRYLREGSI